MNEATQFVYNLFDNAIDHDYMTLDTAERDLAYFASQDDIPSDLTPEFYMNTWNELIDRWKDFWLNTTITYGGKTL